MGKPSEKELYDLIAYASDNTVDEESSRRVLLKTVESLKGHIGNHSVPWNAQRWRDGFAAKGLSLDPIGELAARTSSASRSHDGLNYLTRSNAFAVRDNDPIEFFIGVMAWGYGRVGYGWHRTASVLKNNGERRVETAIQRMRAAWVETSGGVAEHAREVWRAWSYRDRAKLHGVGTAFASKIAYFAAFDEAKGEGPLIADVNTAWALWALADVWDSRSSPEHYAEYLQIAGDWAEQIGCRTDEIERALFELGPRIRALHRSRGS